MNVGKNNAIEEALCFGWIDSERFARKFSPR